MKNKLIYKIVLFLNLMFYISSFGQNTCNGFSATVSSSTILTGANIPLNITVPSVGQNCIKTISVSSSTNLVHVSGPLTDSPIPNNGQNYNVFFKFPGGITCNGAIGTLTVTMTIDCNGEISTCQRTVNVTASAANYWNITKSYVSGNMTCGSSTWRFTVSHNNPNGNGLGAYDLSGNIIETIGLPINSGASHIVSLPATANGNYSYTTSTQNCVNEGQTITNTASYNFNLGNGCAIVSGNVTATSPPMISPNTTANLYKYTTYTGLPSNPQNFSGCSYSYKIVLQNNGNTPISNITINDVLNTTDLNIITPVAPSQFTVSNIGSNYTWTSNPGFVLNVGSQVVITIHFTITASAGTIISNTATASYQGGNGLNAGGTVSSCVGINCPTINNNILNTQATTEFTVSQASALPKIIKCNIPNSATLPIYNVGQAIPFKIVILNMGNLTLTDVVNDVLNNANQSLDIIPSSLTATYYANQSSGHVWNCSFPFSGVGVPIWSNGSAVSHSIANLNFIPNTINLQNPIFNISIPGVCNVVNMANAIEITFMANALPQPFGNKINKATISNLESTANYTINQRGELSIEKAANTEYVEIGGNFNYNLTVTNMGSVALNNIVVIDNLPSCVNRNGNITVRQNNMNVNFTQVGNVNITVAPGFVLQPGASIIITIPVTRVGEGTFCCNDGANANARLVNPNLQTTISAETNFNSPICVQSTLCCDIPNININWINHPSLYNNNIPLNINTNGVPIQELEISVIDYHVTYDNNLCKPTTGNVLFGNLTSSSSNINGLIRQNNNASSLWWKLNSSSAPLAINNNINLRISRPSILNLSCCNGKFHFCIKVKFKDINCNVCEKIICRSISLKDNLIVYPGGGTKPTIFNNSNRIDQINIDFETKSDMDILNFEIEKIEKSDLNKKDKEYIKSVLNEGQLNNPNNKINN